MESLETLVRFLFCYKRAPDEYTADISTTDGSNNLIQSRTEIAGHAFAFCEVLFEILNILIILNVFAEGGTGGVWVGITLLISMIAGWALTHFGGKRIDQGGIYWAPFFMDSDTYFQDMPRRKKSVKVLSALAFTEVGVFMLQDIPFSVVNGQSGLPYFVDFFEGLYGALILTKALAACLISMLTIILACTNVQWCKKMIDQEEYRRMCFTLKNICTRFWIGCIFLVSGLIFIPCSFLPWP